MVVVGLWSDTDTNLCRMLYKLKVERVVVLDEDGGVDAGENEQLTRARLAGQDNAREGKHKTHGEVSLSCTVPENVKN